jgi:hypothetical protein
LNYIPRGRRLIGHSDLWWTKLFVRRAEHTENPNFDIDIDGWSSSLISSFLKTLLLSYRYCLSWNSST